MSCQMPRPPRLRGSGPCCLVIPLCWKITYPEFKSLTHSEQTYGSLHTPLPHPHHLHKTLQVQSSPREAYPFGHCQGTGGRCHFS